MVISCLTVYVIAFSSITVLGKSYITTTPAPLDMTPRQNDRRSTKVHFQSHVRTDGSLDIASKPDGSLAEVSSESPKVLQSSFVPSNMVKLSNHYKRHGNSNHSYFALYDPVNNVTKKWEASGEDLPSNIPHGDFDNFFREEVNNKKVRTNPKEDLHLEDTKIGGWGKIKNFIEWDILRDLEEEVRIHYNGITAKETIVRTGVDEETGKRRTKRGRRTTGEVSQTTGKTEQGLKLRQLTDKIHFIQLIYNFDNEIQDCEYIKQKTVIRNFLKSFRKDVQNAKAVYEDGIKEIKLRTELEEEDEDYMEEDEGKIEKYSLKEDLEQYEGEDLNSEKEYRNVTFQIIRGDQDLPREFAEWMNYPALKRRCRENHKILKQLAFEKKHGDELSKKLAEEHIERMKRNLDFSLIFPGTKWCGKSHIADKYTSLGGFSKTDKCCRAHDHCYPLISGFEEKYGFYNFRPYTINHCRCDLRRKRDIMDVLLVPGTKWCGKGRRATKYTSLGGFSRTDKCCRVHDTMCPHWIGSLEEKYGLFNWRINTIMHCRCDKRFRACLKMAKTGTANFVGKLFFNVVQTKCFVLKPQEVCTEYSWWGHVCEKKEYRKKAYLRDNLSY